MRTTFGIEEEFMFLDPATLRPADVAERVYAGMAADPEWAAITHQEFLASQIEHASVVFTDLGVARDALTTFRRKLAAEADSLGVIVAGVGTPPDALPFPSITHQPRYERIVRDMNGLIADHQMSGLHVHVGVPDREAGVIALNSVRPWLPLLTAMTGNSPFWRGYDTGYESWRTVQLRRWPTAGSPPRFASSRDYDRRISRILGLGGMAEVELIAWNVRLSEHLPTVEFRMADAQLDAADSLLVAACCRALVERALATEGRVPEEVDIPPELLSAAVMHSAHAGLRARLYDPVEGGLVEARVVLDRLWDAIGPYLDASGDTATVAEYLARLRQVGTGAARQRAAFRRGGTGALGELLARGVSSDPESSVA
ncbi:YbdK family carboxylate-amine ligase [Agromyces protaetiae]|uniref:Putative glutamate--cysteine ligase 2 n=1 Tax=Agromyces protaetiae TaxID=2509455 RepID=A0A4P6FAW8_9MICO|nr:YbdK family carboxylate-amine ligase [Agromyces protaetiae]QAY72964.1 YbdK family carboxylate-amine ligase [Agromyces protaetiae]